MVYESDFYTTRRPYTRPISSHYTITNPGAIIRPITPLQQTQAMNKLPHTIPYIGHKRLVQVIHTPYPVVHYTHQVPVPIRIYSRVRPSVIAAELHRIRDLPRTSSVSYVSRYLNSRDNILFDDEAREIRARADSLLRKIHVFVPRPLSSDFAEVIVPERMRSDDYIRRLLAGRNSAKKEDESSSHWYDSPAHRDFGTGHLAAVSYTAGKPHSRRRPYYKVADLRAADVQSDVNLLSYYAKNRQAAASAYPDPPLTERELRKARALAEDFIQPRPRRASPDPEPVYKPDLATVYEPVEMKKEVKQVAEDKPKDKPETVEYLPEPEAKPKKLCSTRRKYPKAETVQPVPEPIVEPKPEPIVEPEPEQIVATEPEPIVASEPEPIVEPESEPIVVPEQAPIVEQEPEPTPIVEPEPIAEPEPEPVQILEAEPPKEAEPEKSEDLQLEPEPESVPEQVPEEVLAKSPEPIVDEPEILEPQVEEEQIIEAVPEPEIIEVSSEPEVPEIRPEEPVPENLEPAQEPDHEEQIVDAEEKVVECDELPELEGEPEQVHEPEQVNEPEPEPVDDYWGNADETGIRQDDDDVLQRKLDEDELRRQVAELKRQAEEEKRRQAEEARLAEERWKAEIEERERLEREARAARLREIEEQERLEDERRKEEERIEAEKIRDTRIAEEQRRAAELEAIIAQEEEERFSIEKASEEARKRQDIEEKLAEIAINGTEDFNRPDSTTDECHCHDNYKFQEREERPESPDADDDTHIEEEAACLSTDHDDLSESHHYDGEHQGFNSVPVLDAPIDNTPKVEELSSDDDEDA